MTLTMLILLLELLVHIEMKKDISKVILKLLKYPQFPMD